MIYNLDIVNRIWEPLFLFTKRLIRDICYGLLREIIDALSVSVDLVVNLNQFGI